MLIKLQLLCKNCGEEYEPEEDGLIQLDYGVCACCEGQVTPTMQMVPEEGGQMKLQFTKYMRI